MPKKNKKTKKSFVDHFGVAVVVLVGIFFITAAFASFAELDKVQSDELDIAIQLVSN